MDDDEPEYGYGPDGRALWTLRAYHAAQVKRVLRDGGHPQFCSPGWDGHGFVLEHIHLGDNDTRTPYTLASTVDGAAGRIDEPLRFAATLRAAGYRVEPDPTDDGALLVWPKPRRPARSAA
jgi:hypothetical protein